MNLKSIILYNFKNFYGRHVFDMTFENESQNIILVSGPNGSGKTSILEAIRLCLYGKGFRDNSISVLEFNKYLKSILNKDAQQKNDQKLYIQITLELDESLPKYEMTITRSWTLKKDRVEEEFLIKQNDHYLELIPREQWNDYIAILIPPYVTNYFFFNGERVRELAVGRRAETILRESIRDLTGLKLMEQLHSDIGRLTGIINRRYIRQEDIGNEINDLEKELKKERKNFVRVEYKIAELDSKIEELGFKRKEEEQELQRIAGANAEDYKEDKESVDINRQEISKLDDQLRMICNDVLPFKIIDELRDDLLRQLNDERQIKEFLANKHILASIKKQLMQTVEKNQELVKLPKKATRSVKEDIIASITEFEKKVSTHKSKKIVHDLTSRESQSIETFLEDIDNNIVDIIARILMDKDELQAKTKNLNGKIKELPGEEIIQDYVERITSIDRKREICKQERDSLGDRVKKIDENIQNLERRILELETNIVCQDDDQRKIILCKKLQGVINEYSEHIVCFEIDDIEESIYKTYRMLANKEDMVEEIQVNRDNLTITLRDCKGLTVDIENMSTGEKEILVLSILFSLTEVANRKLPIIVDTPIAKLDKCHVNNIIKHFFPNIDQQVIILAHDREFDKESYMKLKPYVAKEYRLSPDPSNRIQLIKTKELASVKQAKVVS